MTELPEDFSQVIFTPENTSIMFNLETNDSDTSKSSKTSVESLEDQKNENNNNSVAGRLASNSSCNPFYGNPSFSVVTYRKNESSLESERSVWKTNFCLDDSQATNNAEDVIVSVKIAPTGKCSVNSFALHDKYGEIRIYCTILTRYSIAFVHKNTVKI